MRAGFSVPRAPVGRAGSRSSNLWARRSPYPTGSEDGAVRVHEAALCRTSEQKFADGGAVANADDGQLGANLVGQLDGLSVGSSPRDSRRNSWSPFTRVSRPLTSSTSYTSVGTHGPAIGVRTLSIGTPPAGSCERGRWQLD